MTHESRFPLLFVIGLGFCQIGWAGSIFDENWAAPIPGRTAPTAEIPKKTDTPTAPSTTVQPPGAPTPTNTAPIAPPAPRPERLAVPTAMEQAKSKKLFREIFSKELADHSAGARRALAIKLIGQTATVTSAPDKFILLAGAADASKEGSDLSDLCIAADGLANTFDVDGLKLKAELAAKTVLHPAPADLAVENVRAGMKLADQLAAVEEYTSATRLLQALRLAAPDALLERQIQSRAKEIDAQRTGAGRVAAQLQKLKASPDDPAANLAVGKYLCFIRGDWSNGLPCLAKGTDAVLKTIASQELARKSDDAEAASSIGDSWAALSAKAQGASLQTSMQRRAVKSYDDALSLLNGLAQIAVEKKRGALMAVLSGMNGHRMSPEEIATRFVFPNKSFHAAGDCITGDSESCDNMNTYTWLAEPENMQAFDFGFAIKSKWYQIIAMDIDGHKYGCSWGHWGNAATNVMGGNNRRAMANGSVKSPNEWATMKVEVSDGKATYFYNGQAIGSCELVQPMTRDSKVKVGFSSNSTPMSIKDVYVSQH